MNAEYIRGLVAPSSETTHENPVVEQAKGILAVMFALTPEEALIVMQAFAGAEFPTLELLAAHVVAVATAPPGGPDLARQRLTLLLFAEGGA